MFQVCGLLLTACIRIFHLRYLTVRICFYKHKQICYEQYAFDKGLLYTKEDERKHSFTRHEEIHYPLKFLKHSRKYIVTCKGDYKTDFGLDDWIYWLTRECVY
jgi:hypothetical protein